MARPRKGDRVTIAAKPERPFAEIIQENATALDMSYGDYMVFLAAHALGHPEYAPAPRKTLETLAGLDIEASPLPVGRAPELAPIQTIPTSKERPHRIAS